MNGKPNIEFDFQMKIEFICIYTYIIHINFISNLIGLQKEIDYAG